MNLASSSTGLRRFDLLSIAPEAWRNGGGLTRQIAAGNWGRAAAAGASDWDWRVSVAEITAPAAFSTFAGFDRSAALVEGQGLTLASRDDALVFHRPGDLHFFAGEAQITSALPQGPVRLLNVMVRRARAVTRMAVYHADTSIEIHRDRQHVLLAAQGRFRLAVLRNRSAYTPPAAGLLLHAAEGLHLSGTSGRLAIESLSPDGCLLHAEIRAR